MSRSKKLRAFAACELAACVVGSAKNEPARSVSPPEKYDFAELFSASDPVQRCTANGIAENERLVGPGFLPEGTEQLQCTCHRDMYLSTLHRAAPGEPALHNAVLQMLMNKDIVEIIFDEDQHPGGMEALVSFFETEGEASLGITVERMSEMMSTVGDFIPTDEEGMIAMVMSLPSCRAAVDESVEFLKPFFPDWDGDPREVRTYGDHLYALQSMAYDQSLDLDLIDQILTEGDPVRDCPTYLAAAGANNPSDETAAEDTDWELVCEETFARLNSSELLKDEEDQLLASRWTLAKMYLDGHASTANEEHFSRYVMATLQDMGVSNDKLTGVCLACLTHVGPSQDLDLPD